MSDNEYEAKVYVGNLNYRSSEDDIREEFEKYGVVENVDIILDRDTRRSKGFGFVLFAEVGDADDAIKALDGKEFDGRSIKVNKAMPRSESGGGGGRSYRGSGGRDGYRSGGSRDQSSRYDDDDRGHGRSSRH